MAELSERGTDTGTAGVPERMDPDAVRRLLTPGPQADEFLADLAALPGPEPADPPTGPPEHALAELGLPPDEIAEALRELPAVTRLPELRWLADRCRRRLAAAHGDLDPLPAWPALRGTDAAARYFYLAVFLAALPDLRAYHAAHGVPAGVTAETLSDVGEKVALHRRTHGTGGLDKPNWFTFHFRGILYSLGRLQFHRRVLGSPAGDHPGGSPALATHIPESGPLSPDACDASFDRAAPFFARHFGVDYRVATCTSWLMDPQLAEYLPAGSNILRFQRRFQPRGRTLPGDHDIVEFVFRRVDADLDALPQNSTLRRAVVAHLRAGRHWDVRTGWLELPPAD